MSDKKKKKASQTSDNEAAEKLDETTCQSGETTEEAASPANEASAEEQDESVKLTAQIEELKSQLEKQHNDYLRLMAEFDNFRKRTLREKADLIKSGGESCMKAILPVIDDFERGLQAIETSEDIDAVKEGMQLIYNKFRSYLEQNGVKEMETLNCDFDPDRHEAIAQIPAASPEQKGKIIDCTQKGYTLNDNVIRFPKVVVAQ